MKALDRHYESLCEPLQMNTAELKRKVRTGRCKTTHPRMKPLLINYQRVSGQEDIMSFANNPTQNQTPNLRWFVGQLVINGVCIFSSGIRDRSSVIALAMPDQLPTTTGPWTDSGL